MGLSKKTLIYSTILSVIIVSCMAGYFIWMLPSLYIDYRHKQNYEMALQIQENYVQNRSYENACVASPMSTISVEIPQDEDYVIISNQFFKMQMNVNDEALSELLDNFGNMDAEWGEDGNRDSDELDFSAMSHIFSDTNSFTQDTTMDATILESRNPFDEDIYQMVSYQFHGLSEDSYAFESSLTDGVNYYSTYMIMSKDGGDVIMTFVFLVTPQMKEIKPIILESLPMIIAVTFLLVLIFSQVFSHYIINPVLRLARHARSMKEMNITSFPPVPVKGKDEISDLGLAWNELNQKLAENYRLLEEENKRQEIFLKASSHQLKTPVAAALLLTEGMIHEVGKYKDTTVYLPQLKEQLQLMQKMIDDILSLNQNISQMEWEAIHLPDLVKECVRQNEILLEKKKLKVIWEEDTGVMEPVKADVSCLQKVIDNLLSNAIHYTPSGEKIVMAFCGNSFSMINYGGRIGEDLLPHIFDPFVTGSIGQKSRGLGLYIVSYYSRLLGCEITIQNVKEGVETILIF